ncbi:hypothetical protein MNQ98_24510 [Paenibacillus sp. N3/727]|uniref:hypothetical protein n=1 Tax=Paenibacillus sp. N3/727 TaxID=2925845 RepID=UPI001F53C89C|nr:hypothetical protein [Paenibacillus sp. N3/727]UNK17586.1 hypothetical protein MNQ98_24510 [Paenibacillus sp. N3/727]
MSSAKDLSIQNKMENIFNHTCGTWQNCTESNIQSFLEQCQEHSIDSQYCMSWVEQHKSQIPDWQVVSKVSLDWVNQHTSTGSPISFTE